jgi:hypothetical protein
MTTKTSVAVIQGDTKYGSTVNFIQGSDRSKIIEKVAEICISIGIIERGMEIFMDYEEYKEVTDWESDEQCKTFLTKMLNKNIHVFDDGDFSSEIYFCITEHSADEWYKHFESIAGGREGMNLTFHDLDTGRQYASP